MTGGAGRVADSTGNWVDGFAPAWTRPYLRLARLDRPIGSWLLLMPCWWSVGLAAVARRTATSISGIVVLFFIGAFAMRGAGCTWNDIVDRDLDARVERTRSRPIPSGQVTVAAAAGFLVAAGAGRARGAAAVQSLHDLCRHRLARHRRDLSLHEADHLLAADRARPRLLLGRADGMAGDVRAARSSRVPALCRRDCLGDRLRHDLRPSGSRGRRADRHQVDRAAVRRAHQADARGVLRAGGRADRAGWMERGRRGRVRARARARLRRISPGRSRGSTSTIPCCASSCSSRTATPG